MYDLIENIFPLMQSNILTGQSIYDAIKSNIQFKKQQAQQKLVAETTITPLPHIPQATIFSVQNIKNILQLFTKLPSNTLINSYLVRNSDSYYITYILETTFPLVILRHPMVPNIDLHPSYPAILFYSKEIQEAINKIGTSNTNFEFNMYGEQANDRMKVSINIVFSSQSSQEHNLTKEWIMGVNTTCNLSLQNKLGDRRVPAEYVAALSHFNISMIRDIMVDYVVPIKSINIAKSMELNIDSNGLCISDPGTGGGERFIYKNDGFLYTTNGLLGMSFDMPIRSKFIKRGNISTSTKMSNYIVVCHYTLEDQTLYFFIQLNSTKNMQIMMENYLASHADEQIVLNDILPTDQNTDVTIIIYLLVPNGKVEQKEMEIVQDEDEAITFD